MKTTLASATLAASVAALAMTLPAAAQAAPGYTDSRVALRAGPGYDYPRVTNLGRNTRLNIHGCIRRFDWCDVSVRGIRGWIPADERYYRYQGRPVRVIEYGPRIALPMLTFSFDTYWHDNYRRSGFYGDRDRYRQVWARDRDRDGIPNRFDRDRDGDGVRNNRDRAPNNPRVSSIDRDLDNDGIRNNRDRDRDGDGVRNSRDVAPNNPRVSSFDRDIDNDGIRNSRDRDRDGDGVRNRNDVAPNNPRRD